MDTYSPSGTQQASVLEVVNLLMPSMLGASGNSSRTAAAARTTVVSASSVVDFLVMVLAEDDMPVHRLLARGSSALSVVLRGLISDF